MAIKARELKIYNGSGTFTCRNLKDQRWHDVPTGQAVSAYVAAYSKVDAAALISQYTGRELNPRELKDWPPLWGTPMDGVEPERGLWLQFEQFGKPVRVVGADSVPKKSSAAPSPELSKALGAIMANEPAPKADKISRAEADRNRVAALEKQQQDARRWRYFSMHAADVVNPGIRLGQWLESKGAAAHGSRDAAIDFLMEQEERRASDRPNRPEQMEKSR